MLELALVVLGALPAAGRPEPFDLTYLPRANGSIVAARPAELVRYGGTPGGVYADHARRTLAALFAFFDGDLRAAAPPALADIETLVTTATCALGIETNPDGTSSFNFVGLSSGVVRTAKPFDWARCVTKWFPKAEPATHAGRSYYRVPVGAGEQKGHLAFFVPDDRTLVFDTDGDELKALLARLEKKLESPPPPGWDEVSRALVAVCLDTRAEGWLKAPDEPKRAVDRALTTVAREGGTVVLGFWAGDETRLHVVATARDEAAAKAVSRALRMFFEDLGDADDAFGPAAKLFGAVRVARTRSVVRATGTVTGNVLRQLAAGD